MTQIGINGSFEMGWADVPILGQNAVNQKPAFWNILWLEPGERLWGSNDEAGGVPEMVHKHKNQLPPNEQKGALDALILDGDYVYKMFHASAPWGAQLSQVITGLERGSLFTVRVPIQAHRHGDADPYGIEAQVIVNTIGEWNNSLPDREWVTYETTAKVDVLGMVTVVIRVKSKWGNPKDIFIDDIVFEGVLKGDDPEPPPPDEGGVVTISIPTGTSEVRLLLDS